MKKQYVKPTIEFESYELDEFVANCTNTMPNQSRTSCEIDYGGLPLFDADVNDGCEMDDSELMPDDGDHDGPCYHIPFTDTNFFGS